jgi:hypothetical protein
MSTFSGAMPLISFRDLLPNAAGQPRLSTFTIAILTAPFSMTNALAYNSPFFCVAFLGVPIPPETGKSGSGVITRTADAALKCCPTVTLLRHRHKKQMRMFLAFILEGVYLFKTKPELRDSPDSPGFKYSP